ncbi:MAG: hypothetical protein LBP20_00295, partial [Treponema sp.]|nr:hypothetical protein [Treponema sp.]
KTIKNLLFVGLIALAAVITLAGCSDAPTVDPLEGTWKKGTFAAKTSVELTIGDSTFKGVRVEPYPPNPQNGVVGTRGLLIGKYVKTAVTDTEAVLQSTYSYNNDQGGRWHDDTYRKGTFTVTGTGAAAVLTVSGTGDSGTWDAPANYGLDGTYYKTWEYE